MKQLSFVKSRNAVDTFRESVVALFYLVLLTPKKPRAALGFIINFCSGVCTHPLGYVLGPRPPACLE